MTQEEFQKLFNEYELTVPTQLDGEWTAVMEKWEEYHNDIISENGLGIDKWLSYTEKADSTKDKEIAENETIVKFICSNKSKYDEDKNYARGFSLFGSATLHGQKSLKIYSAKRKNPDGTEYIDYYNGFENNKNNKSDVEEYYNIKIQFILKKAVEAAGKTEDVFSFFEDNNNGFIETYGDCPLYKGLFILESLREKTTISNVFAWITAPNSIEALEGLLFTEDENNQDNLNDICFLRRNNRVYKRALEWAGLNDPQNQTHEPLYKLNRLLWLISKYDDLFTDYLNPNIIFSGAPATGKTYTVENKIKDLHSIDSALYPSDPTPKFTQFHPSYTYQDFIEGIKPSGFDNAGNLKLEVMNGSFKQFCIDVRTKNEEAWSELTNSGANKPDKDNPDSLLNWPHYYYVVDEINRGNLSSIFGETFTLLEYRDYDFSGEYKESDNSLIETALSTVIKNMDKSIKDADGKEIVNKKREDLIYKEIETDGSIVFGIPFNIHFIGMMNDVDRSIDAFDLAFRRRFKWNPTYCDYDVIKENCGLAEDKINVFVESCKLLNYLITGDERDKSDKTIKQNIKSQNLGITYQIGHGYFLKIKSINLNNPTKELSTKMGMLFDNYLSGTIKEYLIQNVGEGKATEDFLKNLRNAFKDTK